MSVVCNLMTVSSCMYSPPWSQKDARKAQNQWTLLGHDNDQVTAPSAADAKSENMCTKDHRFKELSSRTRKDDSRKDVPFKHVPHKEKPPQVVEKRNARERRRVQAVNNAFIRLRNVVPIENTRGKRVSKVKTLQNAIDYIQCLQELLEDTTDDHCLQFKVDYTFKKNHDCCYKWIY